MADIACAVDLSYLDEAGQRAGQVRDGCGDLVRCDESTHRLAGVQRGAFRLLTPSDNIAAYSFMRRIEEASKFVDIDQLCLSPQCGFSSVLPGNSLTRDEQIAKLRLVVEIAEEVWGTR